jgi:hypothetical protein
MKKRRRRKKNNKRMRKKKRRRRRRKKKKVHDLVMRETFYSILTELVARMTLVRLVK